MEQCIPDRFRQPRQSQQDGSRWVVWCRFLAISSSLLQLHELLYLIFIVGLTTLDSTSKRPDEFLMSIGYLEKLNENMRLSSVHGGNPSDPKISPLGCTISG